ncbi:unnamed protein product [Symbiodinium microadriaticum]|nr:unnamed protein product [Symbiodinium microadriaticum]
MDAQWLSLQYTSPLHLAQRTQDRRLKKEGQRCRPSLPERGRLPEQGFGQGPRAGRQSPAAALRAQKREDSGLRAPRRTRAANYTGHFIEASRHGNFPFHDDCNWPPSTAAIAVLYCVEGYTTSGQGHAGQGKGGCPSRAMARTGTWGDPNIGNFVHSQPAATSDHHSCESESDEVTEIVAVDDDEGAGPAEDPQPKVKPTPSDASGRQTQKGYAKPKPKKRPKILDTEKTETGRSPTEAEPQVENIKSDHPEQQPASPAETRPLVPKAAPRPRDLPDSKMEENREKDSTPADDAVFRDVVEPQTSRPETQATTEAGIPPWAQRMLHRRAKDRATRRATKKSKGPSRPTKKPQWLLPMEDDYDLGRRDNRKDAVKAPSGSKSRRHCTEQSAKSGSGSSTRYKRDLLSLAPLCDSSLDLGTPETDFRELRRPWSIDHYDAKTQAGILAGLLEELLCPSSSHIQITDQEKACLGPLCEYFDLSGYNFARKRAYKRAIRRITTDKRHGPQRERDYRFSLLIPSRDVYNMSASPHPHGTRICLDGGKMPPDQGLAAWRLGGKHLPVLASIPAKVARATDITSLNQMLIQCASEVFPPSKGPHRLALWQNPSMAVGIKGMWEAYRQWKQLANAQSGNALQTARAYQTFKQAHKAFRQEGKACKKQWFNARIGDIQAAARSGDARALFAGVRAVAPKQSKLKVQLRDSKGQLQSAGEQIQQLEKHYRKLYAADADPKVAGETRAPVTLRIEPAAMTRALAQLSPHKATPPGQATNSVWTLASDTVAPVLCDLATRLLDRALLDAEVEVELRNQVMSWYSEVTYFIEHLNRNAQVTAQQGLRQGCQLAPLLWAISVGYVYKTVARNATNPITTPWLQDHTSTYADDIHMMATAKTVSSLDSILLHFGTMLDALTDNDMVINAVKSAFLLKHRGSFIKRWLRRHRRTTPDGDVIYFRTPKGTEYQIPLREQRTYLGVKISYHSMARHTTSHRLQAANSAWQRLRGILCSARNLALADRIALWKATVLPTLMYGLAAVGPGPRRMQAMIIKHARAMAKSFAHLHHEPSQLVLTRCGIRPAAEQLHKETEALLRRFRTQVVCTPFITEENLLDLRLQAATLQADSVTHETEEGLHQALLLILRPGPLFGNILSQQHADMDLDEQERLFFAQMGPIKTKARAKEAKEKERRRAGGAMSPPRGSTTLAPEGPRTMDEPKWESSRTTNYDRQERLDWMENRVQRLTQLALRQEQLLTNLRQDMLLYLFVRSGDAGLVPVLCQSADRWRQLKEEGQINMSLKLAMFKQLLMSLQERLTETAKDSKAMDHAKSLGWLDQDQQWRVLRWNPLQQHLEVEESLKPTSTSDLIAQIIQVRKGVTEDSLLRFKSLRRLSPDVKADWIQFQIAISLRAEAAPLWATLKSWSGQSSWHTLGCRLRRERPQYDALTADLWNS